MVPLAAGPWAGPVTHYEFFSGLRDAQVTFLVTGAVALVLHGVPRLTPDIDLAADPEPASLARLLARLAAWGYRETGATAGEPRETGVRRFRHGQSALDEIDVVAPAAAEFARLQAGCAVATLVDVGIPFVGAADVRRLKEGAGTSRGREDAEALDVLRSVRAGENGDEGDTLREQIRKFSRWSVAARLDWLLAASRLRKGLAPEAKPMTRGLVRRRPWPDR